MARRPRIKMIASDDSLPGAKIVDCEFSNYLEFFLKPEDKLRVLQSMDGYPFTIKFPDNTTYIIKKVPFNLKMIKIFLPIRPPKRTWFYYEKYLATFKLKQVEITDFGYYVTIINYSQ